MKAGVVAIDGTKVAANASRFCNRDYEQIAREVLEEAAAVDHAEDERYGDARGDELPEQLQTKQGRRGWLREAKHRLDERRAEEARPIARSRPQRLAEAKRRLEEEHRVQCEANAAYEHYRLHGKTSDGRRLGKRPKPWKPPERPTGKINLTDPDSRNLKASRGYVQGYNAQAAVNEHGIVLAAEITVDSPDFGHLEPMVTAVQSELEHAAAEEKPGVVLADTGYWHHEQMKRIAGRGIGVLIPPDAPTRKDTRPGWDGGLYAFMRRVLATELGNGLYRKQCQSSPCSPTPSSTGASIASNAAEEPPAARNGASAWPPTTSSSSTTTRQPPQRPDRPHGGLPTAMC